MRSAPLDSTTHFLLAGLDHTRLLRAEMGLSAVALSCVLQKAIGFQAGPYFQKRAHYILHNGFVIWTNSYFYRRVRHIGVFERQPAFRTGLPELGLNAPVVRNLALFYVSGGKPKRPHFIIFWNNQSTSRRPFAT